MSNRTYYTGNAATAQPATIRKEKPMTAKHPRRYYNVTVSDSDGKGEAYGHLSKLNVANVVKMTLDAIEDAPDVSLYIRVAHEPEKLTRVLESRNLGRNLHER